MAERAPEVAAELRAQEDAATAVRSVGLPELQDDVGAQYWGGVYNRLESRAGWGLVVVGTVLVVGYGVYELLTQPDIHTVYRLGMAALLVGFGLLLSSVWRYRAKVRPHDKYKEVVR